MIRQTQPQSHPHPETQPQPQLQRSHNSNHNQNRNRNRIGNHNHNTATTTTQPQPQHESNLQQQPQSQLQSNLKSAEHTTTHNNNLNNKNTFSNNTNNHKDAHCNHDTMANTKLLPTDLQLFVQQTANDTHVKCNRQQPAAWRQRGTKPEQSHGDGAGMRASGRLNLCSEHGALCSTVIHVCRHLNIKYELLLAFGNGLTCALHVNWIIQYICRGAPLREAL
jgi:hypothetical protein